MNNTQTAANVQRIARQGYSVVAHPTNADAVIVEDPYCGYNSGKYAVDGYDAVTVLNKNVGKFLAARN